MTQSQLQEQLRSLRLGHFAQALQQQQSQATTYDEMSFEERLGLLAQHEIHCRQDSKVKRLLRQATLRLEAHASRLEYRAERQQERLTSVDNNFHYDGLFKFAAVQTR